MKKFYHLQSNFAISLRLKWLVIFFACFFLIFSSFATDKNEIKLHRIYSPFQKDSTTVRVILPDNFSIHKNYKVLYVLPVREEFNRKNGDGLVEIIKYDLHNKYNLICVSPGFTYSPWYADHSTDNTKQDESHFLKTVLPFVDENYPTIRTKEGRLLLGFSKSGWGALTLLLRNPEIFYKAAGWDIGIRIDTGPIEESERTKRIERLFGDKENFEKYRISTLLKNNGKQLGNKPRFFYYNTEGIRAKGGVVIHSLMVELEIPHKYLFEPFRKHQWDSGWFPAAVEFLVQNK